MTRLKIGLRVTVSIATIALLIVAAYWSLRLGYADYLGHASSSQQVEQAVKYAPGNSRYRARLAAVLSLWGNDQTAAVNALEAAVALNPRDSTSWIELGLRAEMEGDLAKAEKYLLEASRVDKQYDPRWALANFYFRRNDAEQFWPWAKQAARMAYSDPSALFRLSWRLTPDPDVILERAIPDQPIILEKYLKFLLAENHLEAVGAAALKLVKQGGEKNLPVLLAACTRLLEAGEWKDALRIWGGLCTRKLIPYQIPGTGRGLSLTNGDFHSPFLSYGFDWRVETTEGVLVLRRASPPGLRVTFSGRQPESCNILSQFIPLLPGKKYRLQFRYRTSGIAAGTGLRWRIVDTVTGREMIKHSPDLSSEVESQEEVVFSTAAATRLGRLLLSYQRAPGTTRIEGSISLRDASIEFAPSSEP